MCGRVAIASSSKELSQHMNVDVVVATLEEPDHNVAPTGLVPMVWTARRADTTGNCTPNAATTRTLGIARWGFVPSWEQGPSIGGRLFNARAETVAEKPSFRAALRQRRCLIPVDGFFEWGPAVPGSREQIQKQPWYVQRVDGNPMVLAGLWEEWSQGGEIGCVPVMNTCTVITVQANVDLETVHSRMPVVVESDSWANWLAPTVTNPGDVLSILRSAESGVLRVHPVDHRVGNTRNKGSDLLKEVSVLVDGSNGAGGQVTLW
ncbi:MAG: DUF159 family protein [Acidimicrobiaceae bacterium]|nr:DUF159 family protein [Acidimicrobiaceae bacterium]HJO79653.1 SOS response-associated peptidase [Acidimicrobiales bacterium]